MPTDQSRFVSAIDQIRADAAEHQDDARRLGVLRSELCKTLADAAGWTGNIANAFDSNLGRKTAILVNISPHIVVRTAFAGDRTRTLIPQELCPVPGGIQFVGGNSVQFSGSFVTDFGSCGESKNTLDALQEPNFVFRFSDIRKYEAQ